MSDMKAIRDAYGEGLAELGAKYDDLYVLDADLAKATKTITFKKAFPDRFIDCGIAEGNMVCIAAGMASCGKRVFASSFAMFAAGRAYEQVRNSIGYTHLPVKVVGSHAGLTVGEDGATHQCLEDLALMRAIPGMAVVSPSDANQMKAVLRFAVEYDGPMYIRSSRLAVPVVYAPDVTYTLGQSYRLAEGDFATVMFTGPFHTLAAEIRQVLAKIGLECRIVDMPSVKPLDTEAVRAAASETGLVVTIEDHNINGGFGSAVCEAVTEMDLPASASRRVLRIGVNDQFGKSGTPAQLMVEYGFEATAVARRMLEAVCPEKLPLLS